MPPSKFEGLNRAYPTAQEVGIVSNSGVNLVYWASQEISNFVDIFRHHESDIITDSGLNYPVLEDRLRSQGIVKPRQRITMPYSKLVLIPCLDLHLPSWSS